MNINKNKNRESEIIELQRKILELNEIQTNILECVNTQADKIDSIEENILQIDYRVENSKNDLEIANKYSFGYTPILVGSVIGACVFGPASVLLHLPANSLCYSAGGLFGGLLGYKIQKL